MALDELKIGGMGASRRRVEDNRFIRGKGRYIDDVVLPGMLHMEILRSPVAHARIKSIDTSAAWEVPGVRLVMTGETLAARNLAWMPTLSYDTQAVMATIRRVNSPTLRSPSTWSSPLGPVPSSPGSAARVAVLITDTVSSLGLVT